VCPKKKNSNMLEGAKAILGEVGAEPEGHLLRELFLFINNTNGLVLIIVVLFFLYSIIVFILFMVKNHMKRVFVANKWVNEAVTRHNISLGVPLRLLFSWKENLVEPVLFPGYAPPQKEQNQ
jgi:hypothetical protein